MAFVMILNEKAACFPIWCAAFHKINCLTAGITCKICKIVFVISRIKHVPFYICVFNFIIFFFRLLQLLYQQNTIIVNMDLHSTFMISQITHAYTKTLFCTVHDQGVFWKLANEGQTGPFIKKNGVQESGHQIQKTWVRFENLYILHRSDSQDALPSFWNILGYWKSLGSNHCKEVFLVK